MVERRALRIIAVSFFALAAYVTFDSVRTLLGAGEAEPSTAGLVLAALSLAIMPGLSYAQRRAGRELGSASAVADSKQTLLCTYLSAVLLVGLAVNGSSALRKVTLRFEFGDQTPTVCVVKRHSTSEPVQDPSGYICHNENLFIFTEVFSDHLPPLQVDQFGKTDVFEMCAGDLIHKSQSVGAGMHHTVNPEPPSHCTVHHTIITQSYRRARGRSYRLSPFRGRRAVRSVAVVLTVSLFTETPSTHDVPSGTTVTLLAASSEVTLLRHESHSRNSDISSEWQRHL
ncbi:cation transporter [Actinomadura rudentiformis]